MHSNKQLQAWTTFIMNETRPFFCDQHILFVDFTEFKHQMPVYINLVRDPVDRFVSWFYFKQNFIQPWPPKLRNITMDQCFERNYSECTHFCFEHNSYLLIPYFCGQDQFCREPTRQALLRAEENVIKYYAVVGTSEQYDLFLDVLENILPQYFKGVTTDYKTQKRLNTAQKSTKLSRQNRNRLKEMMALEYKFYNFIEDRLRILHKKLQLC